MVINALSGLQILEGINYVAIIILTGIAVIFTVKTYFLQAEKTYKIICRLSYLENGNIGYSRTYGLEIYNNGNKVAENIEITYKGKRIAFIEFLKPEEMYSIPLGQSVQVLSGETHFISSINIIKLEKGKDLIIDVKVSEERKTKSFNYKLSTDSVFAYQFSPNGTLKDVEKSIDKLTREVKTLKKTR